MKDQIKKALDNTELIRKIVLKNILPTLDEDGGKAYTKQMEEWYPAMVICSKCGTTQYNNKKAGRIFANRVLDYFPGTSEVTYECPNPKCNNKEKVNLYDSRVKLNWRVDWPAKWDLFKTTCEPAGKDHATKGGSYDTGLELCNAVFGYEGPIKVPYEWLRLGDQDMSTSGGIVFNPREYLNIGGLPEAFRHLIVKTKPLTHISFRVEQLPQMFDDYERFERIYFGIEEVDEEEVEVSKYMFPVTQVGKLPRKLPVRIPFRFQVVMAQIQEILDDAIIVQKCNEMRERVNFDVDVTEMKQQDVKDQLTRALYWVNTYAPKQYRFNVSKELDPTIKKAFNDEQRAIYSRLLEIVENHEYRDEQELQNSIFKIAKEDLDIKPKKVFQAIYKVFLGKKSGPRLGPFLIALDEKFIISRLKEAISD